MSRRVLGDDPFAKSPEASAKSERPAKKSEKPPKKADKKPAKKLSARPAKKSSAPSQPAVPVTVEGADAPHDAEALPVDFTPAGAVLAETETAALRPVESVPAPEVAEEVIEIPIPSARPNALEGFVAMPSTPSEEATEEALGAVDLPPDVARSEETIEGAPAQGEPEPLATAPSGDIDLKDAIRDLESRLDQLLQASREGAEESDSGLFDRVSDRLRAARDGEPERTAQDTTRELFASDYYLRQWGRLALRERGEEVDEFGYDPDYDARWKALFDFLYERWWRVEVIGVDKVPNDGRVALVANHSGAVPYDGIMLAEALRREHPARRQVRWLADDFVFHLPFVGASLTRLGAVRACQENAERLLRKERCVGIFPEGVKGVSKLYRDRYQLQRFGRGGHIKLALRMRAPVIPVTIVGAEETHPLLAPSGWMARLLGVPYVPITPTFPWLGALGAIPAPSKWRIIFGDPMPTDGYSPDAADDEVLVGRLNEKLRATIQDTLDRALRERRSVFRGWTSPGG